VSPAERIAAIVREKAPAILHHEARFSYFGDTSDGKAGRYREELRQGLLDGIEPLEYVALLRALHRSVPGSVTAQRVHLLDALHLACLASSPIAELSRRTGLTFAVWTTGGHCMAHGASIGSTHHVLVTEADFNGNVATSPTDLGLGIYANGESDGAEHYEQGLDAAVALVAKFFAEHPGIDTK
jgi:hypothetical protein